MNNIVTELVSQSELPDQNLYRIHMDGLYMEVKGEKALPAAEPYLLEACNSQREGKMIAGLGLFIGKKKTNS